MTPEERAALRRIRITLQEVEEMNREVAKPATRPEKIERVLETAEDVRKKREAWRHK